MTEPKKFYVSLRDTENYDLIKHGYLLEQFSVAEQIINCNKRMIDFNQPRSSSHHTQHGSFRYLDSTLMEEVLYEILDEQKPQNIMCFQITEYPDKTQNIVEWSRWRPGGMIRKDYKQSIFYPYVFKYAWPMVFELLVNSGFPMDQYDDLDEVVNTKIEKRNFFDTESDEEEDSDEM